MAKNKLQKIRPMLWFQFFAQLCEVKQLQNYIFCCNNTEICCIFKSLTWHFLANQKFFIQKFLLENNFFDLMRRDRHSKNLVDYVLSCQADHYDIPRILIQKWSSCKTFLKTIFLVKILSFLPTISHLNQIWLPS